MYEEGSQIRRSAKSSRTNIAEGYGRRRYKGEFLKFLTYSQASNDETLDHLEILWETDSLADQSTYERLQVLIGVFGRKLNVFIKSVEKNHR